MTDFNEYSQKGSTLMQQALKKLVDGDIEGFEKDREEANRYFDLFYQSVSSEEGKINMMNEQMYGKTRNFGIIYNVFEQNISNICQNPNEQNKKIIKEGFKLIKSNPLLTEQFKIYDMFEKAHDIEDAKEFVNEASSIIKNFNKKEVKQINEKFINFMRKNKLDEYVEIPEETENLYEAIEYIMLNKKNYNNIKDFIKAQNVIAEHINKNDINEKKEVLTFDKFKDNLNQEEVKLEEGLNADEKEILNLFMDKNTNKRKLFEDNKRNTILKIKKAIETANEEDKEAWNKIYENVNSKNYSEVMSENVLNYAEMLEISNTIEE